jgi:hypothetical protein
MKAGYPAAAARLRSSAARLAARALEVALQQDPQLGERLGEIELRRLLRDAEVHLELVARAVASGDPSQVREWAESVVAPYRRRRVPMGDLVVLFEGLRSTLPSLLAREERVPADAAIDVAIEVFRSHGRVAGDARERNRLLAALYKGG